MTTSWIGDSIRLRLRLLGRPWLILVHQLDILPTSMSSQQYYRHQENYVAFLQELLSDTKRFPGFPRHSDGTVIVDTHPDYAPPRTNEVIGDNKCRGTYGNFSSMLQCGPIFNSLPAIDAHERQLFDKLLWGLVTSTIFVHC